MNSFLNLTQEQLEEKKIKSDDELMLLREFLSPYIKNEIELLDGTPERIIKEKKEEYKERCINDVINVLNENFYAWEVIQKQYGSRKRTCIQVIVRDVTIMNTAGMERYLGDYLQIFYSSDDSKIKVCTFPIRQPYPFYTSYYCHSHYSYRDNFQFASNSCFGAEVGRNLDNFSCTVDSFIMFILTAKSLLYYESSTTSPYQQISKILDEKQELKKAKIQSTTGFNPKIEDRFIFKIIGKRIKSQSLLLRFIPTEPKLKVVRRWKTAKKGDLQMRGVTIGNDILNILPVTKLLDVTFFEEQVYNFPIGDPIIIVPKEILVKQDEVLNKMLAFTAIVMEARKITN